MLCVRIYYITIKIELSSAKQDISQLKQTLRISKYKLPRLEHTLYAAKVDLDTKLPKLEHAFAQAKKDLDKQNAEIKRLSGRLLQAEDKVKGLEYDLKKESSKKP